MNMSNVYLYLIIAVGLLFICFTPVLADDEKPIEGEITVGGSLNDKLKGKEQGAKGAAEYQSIYDKGSNWDLNGRFKYRGGNLDLDGSARYQDSEDQEYRGDLSLNRIILYKTDYNKFMHRLDHDKLENLEAHIFKGAGTPGAPVGLPFSSPIPGKNPDGTAITAGQSIIGAAAVYYTDHGPGDDYSVTRSEWNSRIVFNIPQIPELKLGFDHRMEKRTGCVQSRTMSKCSACHIEAYSKDINELTNDFIPKLSLRLEALVIDYSYMHREFDDSGDKMYNNYNKLASAHVAPFGPKLQFDGTYGALPFDRTPESTKDSHSLKLRYDIDKKNTVMAGAVYSVSTNRGTDSSYNALLGNYGKDLDLKSGSLFAKIHSHITKKLSLTAQVRYQTLNNDNVFINVNDQRQIDAFKNEPFSTYDFTRKSGYDLNLYTGGVDLTYKLSRTIAIMGGYEYRREERENNKEHNVPHDTDEHIFRLAGDWQLNNGPRFNLGYKLMLANDVYALYKAVCAPSGQFATYAGPATDNWNYYRTYAPNIYDARTGTRSNMPNRLHEIGLKAGWSPIQILFTNLYAKYRIGNNNEVDGRDWHQNLFTGGLNLVLAPNEKMAFSAGYNYFYDKYESMYCIAVYDG
ncbi:MAG: GSU2204 family CXXCH-containing (seleno)protein [Dissulfurimicrobium sp.]